MFVLLATYCTTYDYNTPSVDIVCRDSSPVLIVNSKGESLVINPPTTIYETDVIKVLNSHNEKIVDNVLITEKDEFTPLYLMDLYGAISVENTYFCYDSPQIFENRSISKVKTLTIGGNVKINAKTINHILKLSQIVKNLF